MAIKRLILALLLLTLPAFGQLSFINKCSGTTSCASVPAHQAGDLFIAYAGANSTTTAPTLPTGWTSMGTSSINGTSTADSAVRLSCKVATTSGETVTGFTGAGALVVHIYRGPATLTTAVCASGNGTASFFATAINTTPTTATWNALTNAASTSWDLGFIYAPSATAGLTTGPTGMTTNRSSQGTIMAGFDTNAGVASFTSTSTSWTTGSRAITAVVEIKAPTADAPTITSASGSFTTNNNDTSFTISNGGSAVSSPTFCYTVDGDTPAASTPGTCSNDTGGHASLTYSGSVNVTATATVVKALATKAGANNSSVTSQTFTLTAATPVASPTGTTFTGSISVGLSTTTTSGVIHYTTDGSSPTCSSTTYSTTLSFSSTTTLKSVACKTNYVTSAVQSDTYTLHVAGTYYVSTTGSAPWSGAGNCTSIATPCSLATANANAGAGDIVDMRAGTYSDYINPTNSGTSSSAVITYRPHTSETVTLSGTYCVQIDSKSYIKVDGGSGWLSYGLNSRFVCDTPGSVTLDIINDAHFNEITGMKFTGSARVGYIGKTSANPSTWATDNWIHDNWWTYSGAQGCTDGGADNLRIGTAQGTYGGGTADSDNHNTVENNFFEHAQHASFDNYGLYTVFRNNILHNEPWSSGCATGITWPNSAADFSSSNPNYASYAGLYGHRNFQITEDYNRVGTYVLVEGNRSGFAGINQANDGPDNFDLAAPQNIVRYNFFYGAMNFDLLFKYGWNYGLNGGGHGGTYNRVYNNTHYNAGYGYYYASNYPSPCNLANCPMAMTEVGLYAGTQSGEGNVLKNNLFYQPSIGVSRGYPLRGYDVADKGAPSNGWSLIGSVVNNWCSGTQTGGDSGGCAVGKTGDPLFINPDMSSPSSQTLPNLGLQSGSGALNAGVALTTATSAGSSTTTLPVADALYFQDGTWGSALAKASAGLGGTFQADVICVGTVSNCATISSIIYGGVDGNGKPVAAGTITLASPLTWSNGASVWLYSKSDGTRVLYGSAPHIGAGFATSAPAASLSCGDAKCSTPFTSIAYGNQTATSSSAPVTVTLTNSGTSTLNISSIALLTGTAYSIGSNTCGSTLAIGASCTLTVTFTPPTGTSYNDTLRFTTDAATSPNDISLTGTGVGPPATTAALYVNVANRTQVHVCQGQSATLNWTVVGDTNLACSIDNGIGSLTITDPNGTNGSNSVSPTSSTTYTLSCSSTTGTASANIAVSVGRCGGPF